MNKKLEYRVVCTQERFKDNIFIDIAPVEKTTHEALYYTRLQYQRNQFNQELEDYGTHSVFLTDENGKVDIDFSQGAKGRKGSIEWESHMRMCERIRPQIVETYQKMISEGKNQTFTPILSPTEVELYKDLLREKENPTLKNFKEKHQKDLKRTASSPEEERTIQTRLFFNELQERRRAGAAMRTIKEGNLTSVELLRRRLSRDGD